MNHTNNQPAKYFTNQPNIQLTHTPTARLSTLLAESPRVATREHVVGYRSIPERTPLSCYSTLIDTAGRRVLPGHLLRRTEVTSIISLASDTCQARARVVGCSGEEAVFDIRVERLSQSGRRAPAWKLRRQQPRCRTAADAGAADGPACGPPEAAPGSGATWRDEPGSSGGSGGCEVRLSGGASGSHGSCSSAAAAKNLGPLWEESAQ